MPNFSFHLNRVARVSSLTVLFAAIALKPSDASRAQRAKEPPVSVTQVSTRPTQGGTVVTLAADVPLTRAQTWQDGEGYHVVLPNTSRSSLKGGVPRGVHARQLGRSLELLVPVNPGASVTVEPRFNRLDVVVDGGMNSAARDSDYQASTQTPRTQERAKASSSGASSTRAPRERRVSKASAPVAYAVSNQPPAAIAQTSPAKTSAHGEAKDVAQATAAPVSATNNVASTNTVAKNSPTANSPTANPQQPVPASGVGTTPANPVTASTPPASADDSVLSYLLSTTGVLAMVLLGLAALVVLRLRKRSGESVEVKSEEIVVVEPATSAETKAAAEAVERRKNERRKEARRNSDQQSVASKAVALSAPDGEHHEQALEWRPPAQVPAAAALFGAYRVDQEVGKLVLGQPHRMDVLASRSPDDRRAIETSLLKTISDTALDEASRRRARQALEDYGFVARQSAAMLLASDAFERATAARTLGEIGTPASLPFMLEALYDNDAIVRMQAVTSIGALKMPAAIGALLDLARRHPEIPSTLLSRVLNACTFDGIEVGDMFGAEQAMLPAGIKANWTGEITQLEPATRVEELPEWLEDEKLADAIAALESTDVEARLAAARNLAQFQVQRSVEALAMMVARDEESAVRAAAVTSLGTIDHESVFASILIALSDEAKEVTAAAARALNRLSFDRADAFVRVAETSDAETLVKVSRSCIKAGMVMPAINRLASEDRRQAYEAFSLLSLLAKSNETEPILDAIAEHKDMEVRLSALRLLGMAGRHEVVQQLRQLAVRDGMPEKLRTALLDVVYKIDQAQYV